MTSEEFRIFEEEASRSARYEFMRRALVYDHERVAWRRRLFARRIERRIRTYCRRSFLMGFLPSLMLVAALINWGLYP